MGDSEKVVEEGGSRSLVRPSLPTKRTCIPALHVRPRGRRTTEVGRSRSPTKIGPNDQYSATLLLTNKNLLVYNPSRAGDISSFEVFMSHLPTAARFIPRANRIVPIVIAIAQYQLYQVSSVHPKCCLMWRGMLDYSIQSSAPQLSQKLIR
jgi:hypothetical protein